MSLFEKKKILCTYPMSENIAISLKKSPKKIGKNRWWNELKSAVERLQNCFWNLAVAFSCQQWWFLMKSSWVRQVNINPWNILDKKYKLLFVGHLWLRLWWSVLFRECCCFRFRFPFWREKFREIDFTKKMFKKKIRFFKNFKFNSSNSTVQWKLPNCCWIQCQLVLQCYLLAI